MKTNQIKEMNNLTTQCNNCGDNVPIDQDELGFYCAGCGQPVELV